MQKVSDGGEGFPCKFPLKTGLTATKFPFRGRLKGSIRERDGRNVFGISKLQGGIQLTGIMYRAYVCLFVFVGLELFVPRSVTVLFAF